MNKFIPKHLLKKLKSLIEKSRFLTIVFLGAFLTLAVQGQTEDKTAEVNSLITTQNFEKKPGAAVLVIENGKVAYQKGYGLADLKSGRAIAADTAFDLASVSKQFTAMAILQLAERGKLGLNDSLRKFYPEFPAYADKITIRHLLNHTSGLPDYIELFIKSGKIANERARGGFEPTGDDTIKLLAEQKEPLSATGEKWAYSNSGYVVLAKIVEKVSGMHYSQFVRKNIFEPLKMTQSIVYDETKPKIHNRAVSYQKKGESYEDVDYTPLNLIYGDGSINSTLEDLVKWDAALYTEKLIKTQTLRQAFTPGKINDGKPTNYGFGWFVKQTPHGQELSHSGGWAGFRNFIVRYPEKKLTVVLLSNSAEFNPVQMGMKIARIFLGEAKPAAIDAKTAEQNSSRSGKSRTR